MRTKTLGGGRRAPSATATATARHDYDSWHSGCDCDPSRPHATARTIPFIHTQGQAQDAYNATENDDDDDDLGDVPMAGSDDVLNHDSPNCIDLLDKKVCISCCEVGGELVCSETGCPVTLHAKCISSEPKFDDLGNFYCPYCWYKRAVEKCQELRTKVMIAKNALSKFLHKNVVTGGEILLDGSNSQDTVGAHSQPLQSKGDQQRKMHKAAGDQYEVAVEDQADAANAGDFRVCRGEEMPVHIKLVEDSRNCKQIDDPNTSETHGARFVEGKENIETGDPGPNKEEVHERIVEEVVEEAEPLSAYHLGKYTDKGRMEDRGKVLEREPTVSATGSSVSETIDSDSEALSLEKGHVGRKAQKTAYPPKVSSVRKLSLRKRDTAGKSNCYIKEEVTSSKTLRQPQRSPKQAKKRTSLNAKRKRLRWTAEEEEALKEGVLMFSVENQNIPWRKILEFGSDVFDNTRTPVDLKDKWKNIAARGGCK